MTLELLLLILESILLAATLVLLVYSIREGKHRDQLIREVGKATRILTRQEYFLAVADAMAGARREIVGSVTGRLPEAADRKRLRNIVGRIRRLARRGVRVAYLLPRFPDRLAVGSLFTRAGAEVRYSRCATVQDLRYMVVDGRLVVLGIPEGTGNREATRKGYRIPSEGLARLLADDFAACWSRATPYPTYAREIIAESGGSLSALARELCMDEKELRRLAP